jgi:hypothetical protein
MYRCYNLLPEQLARAFSLMNAGATVDGDLFNAKSQINGKSNEHFEL